LPDRLVAGSRDAWHSRERMVPKPRPRSITACAASAIGFVLMSLPAWAGAQGPAASPLAQTLFEEGRALMLKGDAATACPKFAESQRLEPAGGTLLNLAVLLGASNGTPDPTTMVPGTAGVLWRGSW
jgi:hypothetical protein